VYIVLIIYVYNRDGSKCICNVIFCHYVSSCGPGSVVGIETGYGLDGPGIESVYLQSLSEKVVQ
jgi:hypothetical protein